MTRPLYLPLHRITPHEQIADQIEEQDFEARFHTSLRAPLDDEPETVITDFGGLAEPRKSLVRKIADKIGHGTDAELLAKLDARTRAQVQCNRDALMGVWTLMKRPWFVAAVAIVSYAYWIKP